MVVAYEPCNKGLYTLLVIAGLKYYEGFPYSGVGDGGLVVGLLYELYTEGFYIRDYESFVI